MTTSRLSTNAIRRARSERRSLDQRADALGVLDDGLDVVTRRDATRRGPRPRCAAASRRDPRARARRPRGGGRGRRRRGRRRSRRPGRRRRPRSSSTSSRPPRRLGEVVRRERGEVARPAHRGERVESAARRSSKPAPLELVEPAVDVRGRALRAPRGSATTTQKSCGSSSGVEPLARPLGELRAPARGRTERRRRARGELVRAARRSGRRAAVREDERRAASALPPPRPGGDGIRLRIRTRQRARRRLRGEPLERRAHERVLAEALDREARPRARPRPRRRCRSAA